MGDPAKQPPLPEWEFALVPPEQTYTSKRWQQSNWLQAFEGGIDSSHVTFLHSGGLKTDPLFKGAKGNEYNLNDTKPFFEVADSEGGLFVGARRNAEEGRYYWRITPWVMPNFTMVPPRGDHPIHGHFWVPIDDENCWAYSFDYHPVRALSAEERQAMIDGHGVHSENIPGTYRPVANMDNDYLMDREAQKQRRRTTPGSRASRSRTRRCRRAWARSSTAPRSGWCPPTAASSRPARSCGRPRSRSATRASPRPASTRRTTTCGRRRSCCRRPRRSSTRPGTRSG